MQQAHKIKNRLGKTAFLSNFCPSSHNYSVGSCTHKIRGCNRTGDTYDNNVVKPVAARKLNIKG